MYGLKRYLAPLITLCLLAVLTGAPVVQVPLRTKVVELALPEAAGVPFGIPPLWLTPVGTTTWLFWFLDVVAALLMLFVLALRLHSSALRHPWGGRGRIFVTALLGCVLGVLAANLLRGVAWTLMTEPGLGTYLGYLVVNVVLAGLVGAVVGLVVGGVAVLADTSFRPGRGGGSARPNAVPTRSSAATSTPDEAV